MVKTCLFLCSAFILLSSCFSIKSNSTKSNSKLFETFFVGEEGTQYFIKPIFLEESGVPAYSSEWRYKKNKLFLDATFRYKDVVKGNATINISIQTKSKIKKIKKLTIYNLKHKMSIKEVDFMFIKSEKNKFNSRFTTQVSVDDLNKLFSDPNWTIEMQLEDKKFNFSAIKKTKQVINKINKSVFILF